MTHQESRELLRKLGENMKAHFAGANRWKYIENLLEDNPEDVKLELKNHFDTFLVRMKTLEASDIDLGGPGCCEKIWFRQHGIKSADDTMPKYTIDETDLLIFNLLTETDREQLLQQRFIDFS